MSFSNMTKTTQDIVKKITSNSKVDLIQQVERNNTLMAEALIAKTKHLTAKIGPFNIERDI